MQIYGLFYQTTYYQNYLRKSKTKKIVIEFLREEPQGSQQQQASQIPQQQIQQTPSNFQNLNLTNPSSTDLNQNLITNNQSLHQQQSQGQSQLNANPAPPNVPQQFYQNYNPITKGSVGQ